MLRKFITIQNIGRFERCAAAGDVEFRKFTLIYGENGRGKTTLCAILRSLQSGRKSHITGRQTLGAEAPSGVSILVGGHAAPITYKDGSWSNKLPQLAIFDQSFVSENVYAGDAVGASQKRNLYKVIVGAAAVSLADKYDVLVKDIRALQQTIREATRAVESHLPSGVSVKSFLAAAEDPDIVNKLASAHADLRAATEADRLKVHPGLQAIELRKPVPELDDLLGETIESVGATADRLLREHLATHEMRGGQAWLLQGLDYKPEASCPFCGQDTKDVPLIDAYKVVFSDAYRQLKERITEVGKGVAESLGETALAQFDAKLASNLSVVAFWSSHVDGIADRLPNLRPDDARVYAEATLAVLREKVATPLEPLAVPSNYGMVRAAYNALLGRIAAYNATVAALNTLIQARRAEVARIDVPKAARVVAELEAYKRRHEPLVKKLCDNLLTLQAKKAAMEEERDRIKVRLDGLSDKTVAVYQALINKYLDAFNAGFDIVRVEHNFIGGVKASYQLKINDTEVSLGDEKTPDDVASFKNTLSAGDRSALALSFFLAQLENDPGSGGKIVVFDDPFCSQDSFRRNQTAIEIASTEQCTQTIVLSHDAHFLKLVEEKIHNSPVKCLKLAAVGDSTQIHELDLTNFIQTKAQRHIDVLQRYMSGMQVDAADAVQKIRPLLEHWCRSVCLTLFSADDNLGNILAKIKGTGSDHPLSEVYQRLSDLNDYSSKHMHGDGSIIRPLDEGELRGCVKKTLRLVGAI